MKHSAPAESKGGVPASTDDSSGVTDEAAEEVFKPLSREEAGQWRTRQPQFSVWRVVWWQAALAVVVALLAAWLADPVWAMSAFYGALCAMVPAALMAWGITSNLLVRLFPGAAGATLAGLVVWEGVKVLLSVAMLWSAPHWVQGLDWLALLVGFVVVLKGYWLVLLSQGRRPTR